MEKYTIKEVLVITRNILGGISVPMAYKKEIADPIDHAIDNLTQCINTFLAIEAKEQEKPEEVPEDAGEADTE